MTKNTNWHGVFPAVTTQFNEDYSININSTMDHIELMIQAGVHGFVMLGTVGENNSLQYEEKIELLQATVKKVAGRIPVLTGVSEFSTATACRFAQNAEKIGLDGLMVLPGMAYKADFPEVVAHIKSVALATSLPIMLYNNPVSYGIDITPEGFAQFEAIPNIVAIKESSDDPRRITDLFNLYGDRFILFCGVDDLAFESILLGAQGWVSGLVNAYPEEDVLIWDLLQQGNIAEARELYRWYTPLLHLDTKPKLVQYIKMVNVACGIGTETTRPPRLPIAGAEREQILQIIQTALDNKPQTSLNVNQ